MYNVTKIVNAYNMQVVRDFDLALDNNAIVLLFEPST